MDYENRTISCIQNDGSRYILKYDTLTNFHFCKVVYELKTLENMPKIIVNETFLFCYQHIRTVHYMPNVASNLIRA